MVTPPFTKACPAAGFVSNGKTGAPKSCISTRNGTGMKSFGPAWSPAVGTTRSHESHKSTVAAAQPGQTLVKLLQPLQILQKTDTRFLKGSEAPVDKEVRHENLEVMEGALPPELNGAFFRTGPNPQHTPKGGYHWFDGDGMVHTLRLEGGEAKTYSNNWVKGKRFEEEKADGGDLYMRMGDMKGWNGMAIWSAKGALGYNCTRFEQPMGNTSLLWHHDRLMALTEGGVPYLLRLEEDGTLQSMGAYTFEEALGHNFTAHPKVDPKTGEMLAFVNGVGSLEDIDSSVAYFSVSPSGKKNKSYAVDVQAVQMMHDFAVTENYAIFLDHALQFDGAQMVKAKTLPFKTNEEDKSRIGLLRRAAPEEGVKWFDVDPFVCFHTGAAWEEGSQVHIIASRYARLDLGASLEGTDINPPGEASRFTVDTATGDVTCTRLVAGLDLEFPVIPPHMVTLPAKYSYMAGVAEGIARSGISTLITKIDNKADKDQGLLGTIKLPEDTVGGEFIMVPRHPPSTAHLHDEDDGWLLGFCTNEKTGDSLFMVYDAKTMSSKPVAAVAMQQRVPLGFHALFVHQEQLEKQNMDGVRYSVTGELLDSTAGEDDNGYMLEREKEMVST